MWDTIGVEIAQCRTPPIHNTHVPYVRQTCSSVTPTHTYASSLRARKSNVYHTSTHTQLWIQTHTHCIIHSSTTCIRLPSQVRGFCLSCTACHALVTHIRVTACMTSAWQAVHDKCMTGRIVSRVTIQRHTTYTRQNTPSLHCLYLHHRLFSTRRATNTRISTV